VSGMVEGNPDGQAARPLVRFEAVSKRFGNIVAIERLSLDIFEREFFALLGPSGCGKTTLLRMLAGFEQPSEGRILLDGADISGLPPHRRPVNMMFQSYALFPHLTVEGNIAFGLKQDGMPKAEIAARVREMLTLVKLTGFATSATPRRPTRKHCPERRWSSTTVRATSSRASTSARRFAMPFSNRGIISSAASPSSW